MRRLRVAAIPAVFVFLASCAKDAPQDALSPDGPIADKIHNLFVPVFAVAAVVFVLVQGLIIATVIRHRHRPGRPDPIQVHGNTKLEFGWTVIPALLLVGVAFPTVFTIFDIAREPKGDVLPVEVYGHMWWWEYRYPTLGVVHGQRAAHPDRPAHPAGPAHDRARHPGGQGAGVRPGGHPQLLGPQAGRQAGRRARPGQQADDLGQQGRHLPRPVRRVLQPVPRQHAAQGRQPRRRSSSTSGSRTRRSRSRSRPAATPRPASSSSRARAAASAATPLGGVEGAVARVGPNLTHLMARTTFAGAIFPLNTRKPREPEEVGRRPVGHEADAARTGHRDAEDPACRTTRSTSSWPSWRR